MLVNPQALALQVLGMLIDTGAPFDGCKIGLYKNNLTPTPQTILSELTPCDFDGYSLSSAVVWGTPFNSGADACSVPGSMKEFVATGDTTANVVYGAYIVDGAGTTLLATERFDAPVSVVHEDDGLALLPMLTIPSDLFV